MAALTPEKFKVIGYTEEDANRIDRPTISYWQDAWRRLRKNPIPWGSEVCGAVSRGPASRKWGGGQSGSQLPRCMR